MKSKRRPSSFGVGTSQVLCGRDVGKVFKVPQMIWWPVCRALTSSLVTKGLWYLLRACPSGYSKDCASHLLVCYSLSVSAPLPAAASLPLRAYLTTRAAPPQLSSSEGRMTRRSAQRRRKTAGFRSFRAKCRIRRHDII